MVMVRVVVIIWVVVMLRVAVGLVTAVDEAVAEPQDVARRAEPGEARLEAADVEDRRQCVCLHVAQRTGGSAEMLRDHGGDLRPDRVGIGPTPSSGGSGC
jgi:hypothetical protein